MDRTGVIKKGAMAILLVLAMLVTGFAVVRIDVPNAEGKMSSTRDTGNYYWIDNVSPDPKVSYNWIDTTSQGTNLYMSGSSSSGYVSLGFDFPFYGSTYNSVYVAARGYLCFGGWYYTTGYSSGIPQSSSPNPMICVYWGPSYGNAYYLAGTTADNINYVAIEWPSSTSYGHQYEVILYSTGVIKMQYNRYTSPTYDYGEYHIVGIEGPTGTYGLQYSGYYELNVPPGLAIEYSYAMGGFADLEIDGDGNFPTETIYAEHRYYPVSFKVTDDAGWSDISTTRVYFGPTALGIYAEHTTAGGFPQWNVGGGSDYLSINKTLSNLQTTPNPPNIYDMAVYVMLDFNTPLDGPIDITLWMVGKAALPAMMTFDDAVYLDTSVRLEGDVQVYGEKGQSLPPESYTMENETVSFTGSVLVYNRTETNDPGNWTYPPDPSYFMSIIDDEYREYKDINVSGRTFNISLNMPLRALRKEFRIMVAGLPMDKVRTPILTYALRVDDSTPVAPASLILRADSFKDRETLVDNDDTIFVSWSSVKDSGSGLARYRISDHFDPADASSAIEVDPKITQFIWQGTTEGVFPIYLWAEDYVGHIGDRAAGTIKIDKTGPHFEDFYPSKADDLWINTLSPDLSIFAQDGAESTPGTSGIRPSTIEYSISTNGEDDFQEWISADMFDSEEVQFRVEVKLKPMFLEGDDNYIRYRVKDMAGNGPVMSDNYSLYIDVTEVEFDEFFPTINVWHDKDIIDNRDVSIMITDGTSGVSSNTIYYRITNNKTAEGAYEWKTGIQEEGGWAQVQGKYIEKIEGNKEVWVHFPYNDFVPGETNWIQFMTKDIAGNGEVVEYLKGPGTMSPLYQVLVNTKPVAIISSPFDRQKYNLTDLVTFDAHESYDIDIDQGNLKFEWKEGNKTLGYDMILTNQRFDLKGFHYITLYVGDSVYDYDPVTKVDNRAKAYISIEIMVRVYPPDVDSDGDGMDDLWEYTYLTDVLNPDANVDSDHDGWTNYDEYVGEDRIDPYHGNRDDTDPWDPTEKPPLPIQDSDIGPTPPPFEIWIFVLVVLAGIIIGAVIVLFGYLRIHRKEEVEKREEAEEEAMLATPQLDIPTMPMQMMQTIDTSVPTLPAAPGAEAETQALPPAPQEMGAPPPSPEVPQEGMQQPPQPLYQEQPATSENPLYQAPQ